MAEQLLNQILRRDLSHNHFIDFEDGLVGVEMDIIYLIKNKFVEGRRNDFSFYW